MMFLMVTGSKAKPGSQSLLHLFFVTVGNSLRFFMLGFSGDKNYYLTNLIVWVHSFIFIIYSIDIFLGHEYLSFAFAGDVEFKTV